MRSHIMGFCGCVVLSAIAAGLLGEAIFPSGPYALIGSSIWCGAWASIISSIAYFVAALALKDYAMLKKKSVGAGATARRAATASFALTMVIAIVFLAAVRFRWIDW
jgi:hypothetical protein